MLLNLSALKANPYRDFAVDPMDTEAVEQLRLSIEEDGFWGGVVARSTPAGYEIAAGHHRVEAARAAGLNSAEIFVGDFDDAGMIRIYAKENATQRNNGSSAAAGTVAAAIRYLARESFTKLELANSRVQVGHGGTREKAVGEPAISDLLEGVPGVSESSVRQQLKNLKDSGDYARIIREVEQQVGAAIEAEQARIAAELEAAAEARRQAEAEAHAAAERAAKEQKAAEKRVADAKSRADAAAQVAAEAEAKAAAARAVEAEQRAVSEAKIAEERKAALDAERASFDKLRTKASAAAAKAETKEVVFDLAGVAKHLKTDGLVNGFRDIALSVGIKPYLPVDQQGALAAALVAKSKNTSRALSVEYIREMIWEELLGVRRPNDAAQREQTKAELAKEERHDKLKRAQREFGSASWSMEKAGVAIADLYREWPKGEAFPTSGEFATAIARLNTIVTLFKQQGLL